MLKRISLTILCCILYGFGLAQNNSGGFNPDNPPDPDLFYTLRIEASPVAGGTLTPDGVFRKQSGESIYCRAVARTGYAFRCWMIGDSIVSNVPTFTYTTTREDVILTAYFDQQSYFNPNNPDDPFSDGYYHRLSVYANPSSGGYFNTNNISVVEGQTTNLYAYPYSGYRFMSWKRNGIVVSTSNPLTVTMGSEDMEYTAQFVFDPANPANPNANYFNAATGEVIIDDFASGRLNSCISTLVSYNYTAVRSITVIGSMSSSDFGFARNYSNCEKVDISRTSGYNEVPDYAFRYSYKLKEIHLPSSVTSIRTQAFNRCDSLQSLYCYAITPPTVTSNSFYGMPSGTVIYVPLISQQLYQQAQYWGNYTIMPIDGQTSSLTVVLPQDATTGKYRDMSIELKNVTTGQVSNLVITNNLAYTFMNIMRSTMCNVSVKNQKSLSLGDMTNIAIGNSDDTVTFATLLEPKTAKVNVVNPAGVNVNDSVDITWYDENGKYYGVGDSIGNLLVGMRMKYRIKINDGLSLDYSTPTDTVVVVNDSCNVFNCNLVPISKIVVNGYVKEHNTGNGISNVNVSIVQKFTSRQSRTKLITSDENGFYQDTVFNVPATFAYSHSDYINQSISVSDYTVEAGVSHLSDVLMTPLTGVKACISYTYQRSKRQNDTAEIYNCINNPLDVNYSLFNVTKNRPIDQVYVQYPQLTILNELNIGDSVSFTVTDRQMKFMPVTVGARLDTTGGFNIHFPVFELGLISASFGHCTKHDEVGILFDANGERISQYSYNSLDSLTISELRDGNYYLVSMDRNESYNGFVNLNRFNDVGLVLGQDYLVDSFFVSSGLITEIYNDTIPYLSELHTHLVNKNGSAFVANTSSIVAGNYLTISAVVDIPDSNMNRVSNLKLLVDIPQSVGFINNSVMIGNSVVNNYSVNGNTLTIPFSAVGRNNMIKFCVVPTVSGDFRINSIVQATDSVGPFMSYFGSVNIGVSDITLNVPAQTPKKEVKVSGVSAPGATVEIYDNNTLIGSCTSNQNGVWNVLCPLFNAYNLSSHPLYAKVIVGGNVTLSQTKTCLYNKDAVVQVSKVTMHNGTNTLVFDYENPQQSPGTYRPNSNVFTFNIDFTINDTTLVEYVYLWVMSSTGDWSVLDTEFDTLQGNWYAEEIVDDFSSDVGPVNVYVEYLPKTVFEIDTNYARSVANEYRQMMDSVNILQAYNDSLSAALDSLLADSMNVDTVQLNNIINLICVYSVEYDEDVDAYFTAYVNADSESERNAILDEAYGKNLRDSLTMLTDMSQKIMQMPSFRGNALPTIQYNTNNPSTSYFDYDMDGEWEVDTTRSNTSKSTIVNKKNNESISVFIPNDNTLLMANIIVGAYTFITGQGADYFTRADNHLIDERISKSEALVKKGLNYYKQGNVENAQKLIKSGNNAISDLNRWRCRLNVMSKGAAVLGIGVSAYGVYDHFNEGVQKSRAWDTYISHTASLCQPYSTTLKNEAIQHKGWFNWRNNICGVGKCATLATSVASAVAAPESFGLSLLVGFCAFGADVGLDAWRHNYNNTNDKNYFDMRQKMRDAAKQCKQDDPFKNDPPDPPTSPASIRPRVTDPAGFVYEGVSSNRVPGVTASCYYKDSVENLYGDIVEKAVFWDASEFDQENPLITDSNGFYQWFVPDGFWQVKYEKDGYETTYSEWLPVPPPQLEVNIAMVQNRQPVVSSAHAYSDGVVVEFDKYMIPDLLDTSNIHVKVGNAFVPGTVQLLNEEVAYRDSTVRYASRLKFVPLTPFTAQQVTLIISNRVKSYAGITMQEAFVQTFTLENEVHSIVANPTVIVARGQSARLDVSTLPVGAAAGKRLLVNFASASIASCDSSAYTLDANGSTSISVYGESYGTIGMSLTVENTYASTDVTVSVLRDIDIPAYVSDSDTICSGDTYLWHGMTLTRQGVYCDTIKHTTEKDTIYQMLLTVNNSYLFNQKVTWPTVKGSYSWRGRTLTTDGVYYDSLTTVHTGCDSVYKLTLRFADSYFFEDSATICQNEYYYWRGKRYTQAGVYYDSLMTVDMVDSVYKLTLTVNPAYLFADTAALPADGTAYQWRGRQFYVTGDYYDSLETSLGCDSVYSLHLIDTVHSGVTYTTQSMEIVLAPNPVHSGDVAYIYAEWSDAEREGMVVEILTPSGVTVARVRPESFPVPIFGINTPGLYFLRVVTGSGEAYVRKLIVR